MGASPALSEVFPHINIKEATQLLKGVPHYTSAAKTDLQDFLFWANHVLMMIPPNSVDKTNFVLLQSVGTNFSMELLRNFRERVSRMPTVWIIRHLGRLVYHEQRKDTIQLAMSSTEEQYGCKTLHDFYNRVIELNYCRMPGVEAFTFISDLFMVLSFKVPRFERAALLATMERYYPGFGRRIQGDVMPQDSEDIPDRLNWERSYPHTEPQIAEFCRRLLQAAI